jgi:hypothetical protein
MDAFRSARRTVSDAQAECGKSSGEAVGEVVRYRDTDGDTVTSVRFYGTKPEAGTKVYAAPQHSADIDSMRHLREEISAINCRYHGSPSYDHDAYWFKEKALAAIDAALQAKGVADGI